MQIVLNRQAPGYEYDKRVVTRQSQSIQVTGLTKRLINFGKKRI